MVEELDLEGQRVDHAATIVFSVRHALQKATVPGAAMRATIFPQSGQSNCAIAGPLRAGQPSLARVIWSTICAGVEGGIGTPCAGCPNCVGTEASPPTATGSSPRGTQFAGR